MMRDRRWMWGVTLTVAWLGSLNCLEGRGAERVFRAGAAAVDVTPRKFPVVINGYFTERLAERAHDRCMSRALVLDDGSTRLAIVVVDNLMIPRKLLDLAKELAHDATGIPTDHMMISATHSHTAPSAMACLGSRADPDYVQFLPGEIAKSIQMAATRLQPARIGWAVIDDPAHNHCRRWVFRPDRMNVDPFGNRSVRAHMHPGYQSSNHIGPAGPADTQLSLLAVESLDGKPLAVLGNYAMHYYGASPVSSDFCGRFGDALADLMGVKEKDAFVGMMSQGTSGDSMWMDYSRPAPKRDIAKYTREVAQVAKQAYDSIRFHDWVPLKMAEEKVRLRRRVPDEKRLAWAKDVLAKLGDRPPRSHPEIYAREQIYLHEEPEVELKLQAIKIGELGIATLPNEVYGLTGLKLKAQSPLRPTFNIELANGAQGYIPPPEQHALGGYTTWEARTAGLEVGAEPKIVEILLGLLEDVAERPRRKVTPEQTAYSKAVSSSRPSSFWRLAEMSGTRAHDVVGRRNGTYEPGVAFFFGALADDKKPASRFAQAVQFAGGRMTAPADKVGPTYSVEFWFWNGLPRDARAVTAYLFSLGQDGDSTAKGDHLGIGGTHRNGKNAGRLIFFNGNEKDELLVGRTLLTEKAWHHVAVAREGAKVTIYLDGAETPEINGQITVTRGGKGDRLFFGGRNDGFASLAGMMTEVAFYDRVLSADEAAAHCRLVPVVRRTPQPDVPALSPDKSLSVIRVREGYRVELVAAEPLVIDPVAIAWGIDGRLWVAEMADYPLGIDGRGKPGGRIRYLEDSDGDGKYDRSTVFLEGIPFPTGVLPWRDGVLVTAAPELFYAEDTDGDGKADRREVLFSGFLEGNQQLRVNGLRWGLDGWVYCANGAHHPGYGKDRQIKSVKTGESIVLGSRDFRFRPDTGELDPLSGPSQFGRNRDDWGNWFGVQNSRPLWHYVLEDRYLRRNAHVASPDPRIQVVVPLNPRVYPAKAPQKRFHSFEQSGRFTSACSGMIYRDRLLFGEGMHAFTCEPFHNVVQHNVIDSTGASFSARRDPAESEYDFFASRDRWCRPVMARTGVDGGLWVVDMYRYMIEHPQWLTPEGREELRPFYRHGDDRGRIYRVVPSGESPQFAFDLTKLSTLQLVAKLESSNGPLRDLVSQALIWRADDQAVAALETLAGASKSPLARLHALCTLDVMQRLSSATIMRAMRDSHPGLRLHAIRLAEPRGRSDAELVRAAIALAGDADVRVRLQLACTLGEWTGSAAAAALARLAARDGDDLFFRAAVMSSVNKENLSDVLTALVQQIRRGASNRGESIESSANSMIGHLLAMAVALGDAGGAVDGMELVLADRRADRVAWKFAMVGGLFEALQRRGQALGRFLAAQGERGSKLTSDIDRLVAQARQVVVAEEASVASRVAALQCLLFDPSRAENDRELVGELLTPSVPNPLQIAAVRRLARTTSEEAAGVLLDHWEGSSPSVRREILAVLATRKGWLAQLLDAMEEGHVSRADLDARLRETLAVYPDPKLRERAKKLLGGSGSSERREVVARYQAALKLAGDRGRGAKVFEKQCASCHKIGEIGKEIGPNLLALTDRRPATLLTAILDPSAAVEGKFVTYVVLTNRGRALSGIVGSESGNSLTLVEQDDKRHVVLRREIEAMKSTGKSLMPDGLEKELSLQDMADVIEFVRRAEQR